MKHFTDKKIQVSSLRIMGVLLHLFVVLTMASCDDFEDDQTVPSYLEIDAITLQDNPSDSWSSEEGFFSHLIDGVNITIWVNGDDAETELGTFQLPCRIPVLRKGNIDRITILPVVKQNGIAATRIYYPFYKSIVLNDVCLAPDSVTDLDTLKTYYISKSVMKVAWQEFFEPGPGGLSLDTVVQRLTYNTDTVCSGYGCGVVRVSDSVATLSFWTDTAYNIDGASYVYLEMDYWSDFDFTVGLNNPNTNGGADVNVVAMTLYGRPKAGWQKIYINMGKIWARNYNSYPVMRLYFKILNGEKRSGNLYLDNMKLVVM